MYNNKEVLKKNNEGKKIINRLFNMIIRKPSKFIEKQDLKHNKYRTVSDFISGMTDRYAINLYNSNK
jgi:dGTPase